MVRGSKYCHIAMTYAKPLDLHRKPLRFFEALAHSFVCGQHRNVSFGIRKRNFQKSADKILRVVTITGHIDQAKNQSSSIASTKTLEPSTLTTLTLLLCAMKSPTVTTSTLLSAIRAVPEGRKGVSAVPDFPRYA